MRERDADILRRLGEQIYRIGSGKEQEETLSLWRSLNSLKMIRPMVYIDEIPWHEVNIDNELDLLCEDELCKNIERELRQTLFKWKYFPCDMVVRPYINVYRPIFGLDYGMKIEEKTLSSDPASDISSHKYIDQLQTEEDLEKITINKICTDDAAFEETLSKYHRIFDGVAPLKIVNGQVFGHFLDMVAMWHGAETIIYDIIDRPEFLHKIMQRMTDATINYIDQLEQMGLYEEGQDFIHCSGAFMDWENKIPYNSAKNAWTFGTSQIFSMVSKETHEEFELEYFRRLFERFGYVYYGCCEPLHNKIDMIRKLPNVRKISISPWSDPKTAAENIGSDYVLSNKPSPAMLADVSFNIGAVEEHIKNVIEVCRQNNTPVEFILKDISTVRNSPQRLIQWADSVMKIVKDSV